MGEWEGLLQCFTVPYSTVPVQDEGQAAGNRGYTVQQDYSDTSCFFTRFGRAETY